MNKELSLFEFTENNDSSIDQAVSQNEQSSSLLQSRAQAIQDLSGKIEPEAEGELTVAEPEKDTPLKTYTKQEIFQDAAQNHYQSFGYASPMVFFGKDFFSKQIPVYPLLEDLLSRGVYKNLILSITDDPDEVISNILSFTANK